MMQILFPLHVDEKIGIGLVKIVERDAVDLPDGLGQPAIDAGLFQGRVGKEDQDS